MTKWITTVLCLLLTGCGGGDGAVPAPGSCEQIVSVQVAPASGGVDGSSEISLPVGASLPYQATLTYCDGRTAVTSDGVHWRTSSAAATVTPSGEVTAVSPGEVTLIAREPTQGVEGEASLRVTEAPLVDLSVSPAQLSLPVGLVASVQARARYSDGTLLDASSQVRWESEQPNVVSVDEHGQVRALATGHARVRAYLETLEAEITVTVTDAVITGLSMNPSIAVLPVGLVQRYRINAIDSEGRRYDVTEQADWHIGSPEVAVREGKALLRAIAPGRTLLTVTFNNVTAQGTLTVSDAALESLAVSPSKATQVVGGTQQFAASALYSDGARWDATQAVSWSSDAPQVAAVHADGEATARTPGEATITASLLGQQGRGTLTVKPGMITRISLEDGLTRLPKGGSTTFRALASYDNGTIDDVSTRAAWYVLEQDRDVLSVDANGTVTGLAVGIATLYADLDDQRAAVELNVTAQGTVVTWGPPEGGGDSSSVEDQLTNVREVVGSSFAFAALTSDGRVVTWGDPASGGDSSSVQPRLKNVVSLHGNLGGFAAVREDGSVVSWTQSPYPCNAGRWIDAPVTTDVVSISKAACAFAGIRSDGTVVTWGDGTLGADSDSVRSRLQGVRQIVGNYGAFAALLATGEVVTWGAALTGGDSSGVASELSGVVKLISTNNFFLALTREGRAITWPQITLNPEQQDALQGAQHLYTTNRSVAGLTADGGFVFPYENTIRRYEGVEQVWQASDNQFIVTTRAGDALSIDMFSGSATIQANVRDINAVAFGYNSSALLQPGGSVVTLGPAATALPTTPLVDVVDITALQFHFDPQAPEAFAARTRDGRVIAWGRSTQAADTGAVQERLQHVGAIYSNLQAFAAVIGDAP